MLMNGIETLMLGFCSLRAILSSDRSRKLPIFLLLSFNGTYKNVYLMTVSLPGHQT